MYCVDGRFVTIDEARKTPELAAASNWHALASFACRFVNAQTGLLVDIGSTTTDVIPLVDGRVAASGRTDKERLLSGELLYRGVGRTPICAMTDALPLGDRLCPIAAELFATTADACVLLGDVGEDATADWTADGRPLTKACARQRLARQFCADAEEIDPDDFELIAKAVREIQERELERSVQFVADRLRERPLACVMGGAGEFLANDVIRRVLPDCRVVSLTDEIGDSVSGVAPAHAIAVLAAEAEIVLKSI
jgi:probable H4MPT-linked C1 transfer pathway protein